MSLSEEEFCSIAFPDKKELSDDEVQVITNGFIINMEFSATKASTPALPIDMKREPFYTPLSVKDKSKKENISFQKLIWKSGEGNSVINSLIISTDYRYPQIVAYTKAEISLLPMKMRK